MLYFDWMISVYYFWTIWQRMIIPSDGTYASLLVLSLYIFGKIYLSKIDDDVVCLSLADNVARFGSVNADEFNPVQQTEMLYTKHIIIFPPWRVLLMLSGEMWCSRCLLRNYSSSDNTMEEQFPREDNNIIRAKVFATCQGFFLLKRSRLTFRNCFAHLFFFNRANYIS